MSYDEMYEYELNYNYYSYETTGFDAEGQITSAIVAVSSEELPKVYCLTGHGEQGLTENVSSALEKENLEMEELNLITADVVPEDSDCLLILSPTTDLSEAETEKILDYLKEGGNALILTDYTDTEILTTSDSAYSKQNVQNMTTYEKEEGDVEGPFVLGMLATESVSEASEEETSSSEDETSSSEEETEINAEEDMESTSRETKLAVFTSSSLLDASMDQMVSGGNMKLFTNTLSWMCGHGVSVSIPVKEMKTEYLTLTAASSNFWSMMVIILIPGTFLGYGLFICLRRRKQ